MSLVKYLDPIFHDDPHRHLDYNPKSHILNPKKHNENHGNISVHLYQLIQKHPLLVIIILQISITLLLAIIGIKTMHYPKIEGVI